MQDVDAARCPDCDAEITAENVAQLEAGTESASDQLWERGLFVCPDCGGVLGSYSDYRRTDIIEGSSEGWDRVGGLDR